MGPILSHDASLKLKVDCSKTFYYPAEHLTVNQHDDEQADPIKRFMNWVTDIKLVKISAVILPLSSLFFFCGGDGGSEDTSGFSSRSDALFGRHLVDKT